MKVGLKGGKFTAYPPGTDTTYQKEKGLIERFLGFLLLLLASFGFCFVLFCFVGFSRQGFSV